MIIRGTRSRCQLVILYLSTEPSYRPTHHRVPSKLFLQLARASSTFPSHLARALSTFTIHLARAFLAFPPSASRARALDIRHTARADIRHTAGHQLLSEGSDNQGVPRARSHTAQAAEQFIRTYGRSSIPDALRPRTASRRVITTGGAGKYSHRGKRPRGVYELVGGGSKLQLQKSDKIAATKGHTRERQRA